jgi:hypothetical protein
MWKESYVVPLFSNYYGISILSAIPKHFEKLFCDVVTPIIRPSISAEQHGFVDGRSTVGFSYFVLSELEGLQVDAVYTDFLNAFNRGYYGLFLGTLTRKFENSVVR